MEVFRRHRGTLLCREIRRTPRRILPCMRAIGDSAALCAGTLCSQVPNVIPCGAREAYCRLYAEFSRCGFHCARTVLKNLDGVLTVQPRLLDAASAFLGGTSFAGMTCSALTAGVMALGLGTGEIEHNWWHVLRMVVLLWTGGPAFEDGVNRFNKPMNRGGGLAEWFARQFGSTQCRMITGADFSSAPDVEAYLQTGGVPRCQLIAQKVANQVRLMLKEGSARRQANAA
jgi:hypothetical protein